MSNFQKRACVYFSWLCALVAIGLAAKYGDAVAILLAVVVGLGFAAAVTNHITPQLPECQDPTFEDKMLDLFQQSLKAKPKLVMKAFPDWTCEYCGSVHRNQVRVCSGCGAPKNT